MELAEICKHDNLTNVISIIHKWEIISILNENIKVDKRFLRGLNWIKKLKGNHMPVSYTHLTLPTILPV